MIYLMNTLLFLFFAALAVVSPNQQALKALRQICFTSPYLPSVCSSSISISKDVVCTSDLLKFEGHDFYRQCIEDWQSTVMTELSDPSFVVTRLSSLSDSKCVMNWNLSYIPESIAFAAFLGKRLPGLSLTTFDILHKERVTSQFSWAQLFKFVKTIVSTGEIKVPKAVIQGQTTWTFQIHDGNNKNDKNDDDNKFENITLVRQEEKLNLVRSIDNKILQNRALANHLQEFLYIRKPSSISMYDYDDIIVRRVQFSKSVPGMRQFDIDGLSGQV